MNQANQNVTVDLSPKKINALRLIVGLVAVVFIAYGAFSGQALATFRKAIRICLECIGIG